MRRLLLVWLYQNVTTLKIYKKNYFFEMENFSTTKFCLNFIFSLQCDEFIHYYVYWFNLLKSIVNAFCLASCHIYIIIKIYFIIIFFRKKKEFSYKSWIILKLYHMIDCSFWNTYSNRNLNIHRQIAEKQRP